MEIKTAKPINSQCKHWREGWIFYNCGYCQYDKSPDEDGPRCWGYNSSDCILPKEQE